MGWDGKESDGMVGDSGKAGEAGEAGDVYIRSACGSVRGR